MIFPPLKVWVCLTLLCLEAGSGHAATWYAAADGSSTNGTRALPWGVLYSVTNTNPYLQAGDTVLFKSGTYECVSSNVSLGSYQELEFRKSGTPSAKIHYRAESLWSFHFDGGLLIPTTTSNIVVENFHVYDSQIADRVLTNVWDHPNGIAEYGHGTELLHNLIENTGHPGIGSWSSTAGKYIAGNIIRFIGVDDYSGGYGARGSGMYLQNDLDSPEALINGNISYFNYTTGMKAYGNTDIYGFNFTHNIAAHDNQGGIFYHQDKADSQGVKIFTNFLWQAGIGLGYSLGNANPSNAVIVGNYSSQDHQDGTFSIEDGWSHCIITNNTFVNPVYRCMVQLEMSGQTNYVGTHTWDYNTYYAGNSAAYGSMSFLVKGVALDWAAWTNRILGDTHSSIVTSVPPALVSFPFYPSTNSNFVHVAVFNWPTNATTTVDLSSYFPAGARLSIYDAQNIPNAYTNLTFNGSTVTLDLTRTNRATMLGVFTHRSDTWQGFDPRFRAFVIYRYAGPIPPPGNLHVLE